MIVSVLRKICAFCITAVAVMFVALFVFMQSTAFKSGAVTVLSRALEEQTGYTVTVEDVGGIIPFFCHLYGVDIENEGVTIAHVDKISCSWSSPLMLLVKTVRFDDFVADNVILHAPEGSFASESPPWPSIPWALTAKRLTLSDVFLDGRTPFDSKGTISIDADGGNFSLMQQIYRRENQSVVMAISLNGDSATNHVEASLLFEQRHRGLFSFSAPLIAAALEIDEPWDVFCDLFRGASTPLEYPVKGRAYYAIEHSLLSSLTLPSLTKSLLGYRWHHEGIFSVGIDRSYELLFPRYEENGVAVEGRVSIGNDNRFDDTAFIVTVSDFAPKKHHLLSSLSGGVEFEMRASGSVFSPHVTLEVRGDRIAFSDITLTSLLGTAVFDISSGVMKGRGNFETTIDGTSIQASTAFSGALSDAPTLSLKKSTLIIADTHAFVGDITLASSRSALQAGKLSALVTIERGMYKNYRQGVVLRDIMGSMRVTPTKINIRELTARNAGRGNISASGEMILNAEKMFPYTIKVVLEDSAVMETDLAYAAVSGDIDLRGSFERHSISGELSVLRSRVSIPDRFPVDVPELPVRYVVQDSDGALHSLDSFSALKKRGSIVDIDIQLNFPGNVQITGRGLVSEWHGSVHISGTAEEPMLAGALKNSRGVFMFSGKPFELREGVITFDGASASTIYVAASAEYSLSDATAEIALKGPLNAIKVTLSSTPSLPLEEVLARVMFGRVAEEITAIQGIRLAQTIATLTGGTTAPDIIGQMGKTLGLDQLDITNTDDEYSEAAVKVGKYLVHNVLFTVEKSLLSDANTFALEIELKKQITLSADIDNNSDGNIFLNWKKDY